jgi:hypothetical protein
MTDYAKYTFRAIFSKNSDYSDPDVDSRIRQYVATPDEGFYREREVGTIIETLIVASEFPTSIDTVIIWNQDPTNYIAVGWTDNGANANTQRVPAGKFLVIPDIVPSTAITGIANTAACECLIFATGT